MRTSYEHSISPLILISSTWENRKLISQMTKREIIGRYKGSVAGILWSFLNPIFMLLVYTFVFSVVFKARWGGGDESKAQFAIALFSGMIIHGLFAEVINRAPTLILSNTNYVKKVIFPLQILPIISMGTALFNMLVSLTVLIAAIAIINGEISTTLYLFPIVLAPLIIFTLGLGWMLSALGVYIRDIGQSIGIITSVMMFLSPVFYPISALPIQYQGWIHLNPLTFIIEQGREVLLWGNQPNWAGLLMYTSGAIVIAIIGYAWFQKTRRGFADVL